MRLKLLRDMHVANATLGKLFVDGVFECYTCEDIERIDGPKIHGETAIPRGTYRAIVNRSARFKRDLPLLLNVPNFVGIRIHPGNTPADTEGCILPGRRRSDRAVMESRVAFDALFAKIRDAIAAGEDVEIEVVGE